VNPSRSPIAAVKALIRHQAAYAANSDPAAHAMNKIALILAWNGPLYPIYVLILLGRDALPWSLLTLPVSPVFYAVPWLSRQNSIAGRVFMQLVGAVNTLWCMKLFGADSGVGQFLFPCIMLSALMFRHRERWVMLPLLGVMVALEFLPAPWLGASIMTLTPTESAHLAALNAGSVAFLLAFVVFQLVAIARPAEGGLEGAA
jgi:hypothetical protein